MRARHSCGTSSHARLALSSSCSFEKRVRTSASKAGSLANQRLCAAPYSAPSPNQKRKTSDANIFMNKKRRTA